MSELLAAFGSDVVLVTVAVFVSVVPKNVSLRTLTTSVKTALAPAGNGAANAVTAVPEKVRIKKGPEIWTNETKVVLAGITSVRLTLAASLGPAFETVMV